MKKLLLGILLILCTIFMFVFTACGPTKLETFEANEKKRYVEIGETYNVPKPTAKDNKGNFIVAEVTAVDPDGKNVTVKNFKFTPEKLGEYTVTYTVTVGEDVQSKSYVLEVYDETEPLVDVPFMWYNIAMPGATLNIDDITATDNSGERVTPVTTVYFNNEVVEPVDGVVTFSEIGNYIFEPTSIPAEGEFTGASISTASDFGLNFYANVDTAGTVKATAECGDDVKTLTGKYDAFAASWKFTYPVAAKDFDKDVKVTISEIDGVAVENGDSATYSVSKYIDYVLADETGAYDDVKELVANLKEYCDAAQSYFADSEVVKVTDGVVSSSDLTDYDATVTGEDANVVIQGATLILESKTTINVYFTAPDNTTVCKVNGNEVVATKIDGVENLYVVSVEVVAKDLGVAQVFEIGGYTVNYSAYTYIGTCVDTASDALYNVLQALYDYGVSAYEYSLLG